MRSKQLGALLNTVPPATARPAPPVAVARAPAPSPAPAAVPAPRAADEAPPRNVRRA